LSDGLGVGVSLLCMLIKNFENQERFGDFLASVGVTSPGVMMMSGKGILRVIDIPEMDLRAANIFKQEALSIGAELALPREAAGLKAKKVRGVLIATNKQLEVLYMKLKMQPFGLRKIGDELMRVCSVYGRTEFSLRSPHGREVVLGHAVMGILNVTPDSFSDGGKIFDIKKAVKRAKEMVAEGARIIDIGGESTGPNSKNVSAGEELKRVLPVLKAVRKALPEIFISIDTYKSSVAKVCVEAGADMVNDVTAGRGDKKMFKVLAELKVPMVLMYAKDATPRTSVRAVEYKDVVRTVYDFLKDRIEVAIAAGVNFENVVVDPGMGMFVSAEPGYSFEIVKRLAELRGLGRPILVGASRKSFLGGEMSQRLCGSVACACAALMNGAKIVRVHDVGESVGALNVIKKLC